MTSLLYLSNLTFGNQTHFYQFNIEPVHYSGDLNTQLVWYLNSWKEIVYQMVCNLKLLHYWLISLCSHYVWKEGAFSIPYKTDYLNTKPLENPNFKKFGIQMVGIRMVGIQRVGIQTVGIQIPIEFRCVLYQIPTVTYKDNQEKYSGYGI